MILTGTGGSSGNMLVMPWVANVFGGIQLRADNPLLRFAARAGDPSPSMQWVNLTGECFDPGCPYGGDLGVIPFAASAKTNSGGNWLSVTASPGRVAVSANPAGLAPGIYTGAITFTSDGAVGPTQTPVSLTIWAGSAPALTADPPALSGTGYSCVKTGDLSVAFDAKASTSDGGNWLTVALVQPVTASCGLYVTVDSSRLSPGTHTGGVLVTIPGQSLTIPVTVSIPAPPAPLVGAVVNAASAVEGAIAAREILTIHGAGLSPLVLIDGTAAPALYDSDSQINAVAPDGVAGKSSVTIGAWSVPLAPAAPGIATGAAVEIVISAGSLQSPHGATIAVR